MKVRDLLNSLRNADAESVVLWLPPYADEGEAEEVRVVTTAKEQWTCERHISSSGAILDIHHPSRHGRSIGWNEATDQSWPERVVLLSAAPEVRHG
ncbi:hypothetical protein GGD41_006009 [Paraburkholderia bryophila]|uniref:Uncharacterized protein n=1 Tax=Paraburkholderia bryophila TaxID=420952 RepID=A0A7Y9WEH2_9BURK|nr:hypothetical protein [Paraburkholderia bryophila]